jgi:hypothetical protein
MGTTRITARGSDQLSYCAASTRKTNTTARAKKNIAVLPAWSWRKARSVHSEPIERGSSFLTISCIRATAWQEDVAGE